uniref:Uncharacterized protein n=1 Tax=Globodera rostochiensis TaxID=31243 RepID=A0A914IAW8_GLORO
MENQEINSKKKKKLEHEGCLYIFHMFNADRIWTFIDKLREQQKMVDVNMEQFIAGNDHSPKAKKFRDADRRILSILQRYLNAKAALPQLQDEHQYFHNQITPHLIIEVLRGISSNYRMN